MRARHQHLWMVTDMLHCLVGKIVDQPVFKGRCVDDIACTLLERFVAPFLCKRAEDSVVLLTKKEYPNLFHQSMCAQIRGCVTVYIMCVNVYMCVFIAIVVPTGK